MEREANQRAEDLENLWRRNVSEEIAALRDSGSSYPKWWHTWFSPATIMMALACLALVWNTSARSTATEKDVSTLVGRVTALEANLVTKEWLAREIAYQRDMYAPKSAVDPLVGRVEELRQQLNAIDAKITQINERGAKH